MNKALIANFKDACKSSLIYTNESFSLKSSDD
jgi:hypothetical protein